MEDLVIVLNRIDFNVVALRRHQRVFKWWSSFSWITTAAAWGGKSPRLEEAKVVIDPEKKWERPTLK